MPDADLIALDIGGANLKAADGHGWARTDAFPLWTEWRRLPDALGRLLAGVPARRVVATMTGELADCYPSRADGVAHIVESLVSAAAGREVGVYLVDGRIVPPASAVAEPLLAAASNWHALARLAAARSPTANGLLVDVGSTTTDIVPLVDGSPAPLASDDAGRMLSGELVYTGVERTPLATVVRRLPHRGFRRPVASERFSDTRDVWLLLGGLTEDPGDTGTADGGPATREAARRRLARTLLLEPDAFPPDDALEAARSCAAAQANQVARAVLRVTRARELHPESVVLSGHGEPLARMALAGPFPGLHVVSLVETLGAAVARAAPAHALALIARGLIP